VDTEYQQAMLSIPKILVYMQMGGQELADKNVKKGDILDAVLPNSVHFLSYVSALNTMSPSATSLPLERPGSALHFMRSRPWFFPRLAIENVYEQFHGHREPLADPEVAYFLKGRHFQRKATAAYFMCAVEGVNRLASYLNDLRTYTDSTG